MSDDTDVVGVYRINAESSEGNVSFSCDLKIDMPLSYFYEINNFFLQSDLRLNEAKGDIKKAVFSLYSNKLAEGVVRGVIHNEKTANDYMKEYGEGFATSPYAIIQNFQGGFDLDVETNYYVVSESTSKV